MLDIDKNHFHRGCLKSVVGDAYLLKHNPIYQGVRKLSVRYGYEYVPAWPAYYAMPMNQLDLIVKKKRIPTIENRMLFEKIDQKMAQRCNLGDIPLEMSGHHMHEAAHGIAAHISRKIKCTTDRDRILRSLISESYANALEALSNTFCKTKTHQTFLALNSYIVDSEVLQRRKQRVLAALGIRNLFVVILYSYICSNFLVKSAPLRRTLQVLRKFGYSGSFSSTQKRDLKAIFDEGLRLNLQFRAHTTTFYLRHEGIAVRGGILKSLDFDFLEIIEHQKPWRSFVENLVESVDDFVELRN